MKPCPEPLGVELQAARPRAIREGAIKRMYDGPSSNWEMLVAGAALIQPVTMDQRVFEQ